MPIKNYLSYNVGFSGKRLLDVLIKMPERGVRLLSFITGRRIFQEWYPVAYHRPFQIRVLEFLFLLLELTGIFDIYEAGASLFKPNTRPLSPEEHKIMDELFEAGMNRKKIRVDSLAFFAPRQWNICYVSLNTINSWGKMRPDTFVHELVHIWQYRKIGIAYIPLSLAAQYSQIGYNYGGLRPLQALIKAGKTIWHLNLEQQGEVLRDYYLIKKGKLPKYSAAKASDLAVYEQILEPVLSFAK